MGREADTKNIGICVKDLEGKVISQNSECLRVCGQQLGQVCNKGCMLHYQKSNVDQAFEMGSHHIRNVITDGTLLDATMINDGESLTTLLYAKTDTVQKQLAYIAQFHLSKTEMIIMEKFLQGQKSQEIANQLFISKKTLRTHLNNIYKKIPAELKNEIISTHLGQDK